MHNFCREMKRKAVILLSVLLVSFAHPIHVSVTNIEYDQKLREFSISFRIFYDDFERIINRKYGIHLNLGTADELENQTLYFTKYINENFQIVTNKNSLLKPVFKSKKFDDKAIWLYYIFENNKKVKSVTITNSLMMDLFNDQTNLVIFKSIDFEKGYRLTNSERNIIINLTK